MTVDVGQEVAMRGHGWVRTGDGGRARRRGPAGCVRAGRVLAAVALPALMAFGPAPAAHADDGLTIATDSVFAYDPAASAVHVTVEATVTNVKADEQDGNTTRRFYYSALTLPVPAAATDVHATSEGRQQAVDISEVTARVARARVAFDANLFSGQTRAITLTYELRGEAPRSGALVRANPAYASFVAYGAGDAGRVSVKVVVPAGFETETLGDDVTRTLDGASVVYSSTAIADPDQWYVGVSARNDAGLTRREIDVGARRMAAASWPGDAEWSTFVERDLSTGVPALEALIGQSWPLAQRLTIVEAATPYLRGYAGWFLVRQNKIEVGENLDDRTLLHELSHAWFNRDLFDARWMNEGLAEEDSARGMAALGQPVPTPKPVDTASPNAVTLEQWSSPGRRDTADDSEAWGYNASWSVIHDIATEIGVDGMASVVAAASKDTMAYLPGEPTTATTDWRRLLDLFDEVGGSTRADDLFRTYVVPRDQLARLDERATARRRVAELAASGRGWKAPVGVRRAMESWGFDRVDVLAGEAARALVTRDELAAASSAAKLAPVSPQAAYETAVGGLGPVQDQLDRQLASVRAIAAARAVVGAPRSFVQRVGLMGRTPRQELDRAAVAFEADDTAGADVAAARAAGLVAAAAGLGRHRVTVAGAAAGGALVLVGGGTTAGVRRRRGRRSRRSADERARLAARAAVAPLDPDLAPAPAPALPIEAEPPEEPSPPDEVAP